MTGEDLRELAFPYALDALDDLERRAVENSLRAADADTAAEFTSTVRALRETLAAMTMVDAVPPPADLEAAVLRTVAEHPRTRTGTEPLPTRPAPRTHRGRWLVAAAAATVVVAVGATVAVVANRTEERDDTVTAEVVLEQPDTRSRTVPVATGGTLTVYTSERLAAAGVTFDEVADPGPGRSYQLWLIPPEGAPRSAGVLDTVTTGAPALVTAYQPTDTLALTLEPAGGSPQPTTDPLAAVAPA
ncbi:anti-sigma factor [Nocardia takedensis]